MTPGTSNGTGTIKDLDPANLGLTLSQLGTFGAPGQTRTALAKMTNASGDELSGHLVRFERTRAAFRTSCFPSTFDLGQQIVRTPTCPSLGCADFAYTGSGLAAGGAPVTEAAGRAHMTWTDIDTDTGLSLHGDDGTLGFTYFAPI